MSEVTALLIALAGGLLLGLVYFGGLWLTVQRLPASRRPALLMVGSQAVRTALAVLGMYVVADGRWQAVAVCLVGMLLARAALRWRIATLALPRPGGHARDGIA